MDCQEALITMVQVMPKLASVIKVGIAKECKLKIIVYRQDWHDVPSVYLCLSSVHLSTGMPT